MMRTLWFLLLLFPCGYQELMAQTIQGYSESYAFKAPGDSAYLETSVNLLASSLHYIKKEDKEFHGALHISIAYRQNNTLVQLLSYVLNTPGLPDTATYNDFKRVILPQGLTEVTVQVKDQHDTLQPAWKQVQHIQAAFPTGSLSFSNIELIDSFTHEIPGSLNNKSGYWIRPLGIDFASVSVQKLVFYTEFYGASTATADSNILVNYCIRNSHDEIAKGLAGDQKMRTAPTNILFASFDISDLYSGNYTLAITVRDRHNKLLGETSLLFMRQHMLHISSLTDVAQLDPGTTFLNLLRNDSIRFYLKALTPVASGFESEKIDVLTAGQDTLLMKKFMYYFWLKRNENDPVSAWLNYKKMVDYTEQQWGSHRMRGYETDRGRVYLFYGPPDFASGVVYEPQAYPYEVWHYYQIQKTGQTNVHFVFYDPIQASDNLKLLYSDAIGEIKDDHWKIKIYRGLADSNSNLDDQGSFQQSLGSQLEDYMNK